MQKKHLQVLAVIAFLIVSCSPSKKTEGLIVNNQKQNGKSFQKIFIVGSTADIQYRVRLENDLSAAAMSGGYASVKSLDVIPFSLNEPKAPAKEEIEAKAKENGCDAVLIVSFLQKEQAISFKEGFSRKANTPFLTGLLEMAFTKNRDFRQQGIVKETPAVDIPGQYSIKKDAFIFQSIFYDLSTEEIMNSVQSENFDIASMDKISKSYTAKLMAELEKEKLLKK